MGDIDIFSIMKTLHIIFVISWLCGLLYLPRIFVYHVKAKVGGELDKTLQIMERKLLRFIMNPAMILAIIFGLWLGHSIGFDSVWIQVKITLVLLLAGFHGFLAHTRKNFAKGENKHSERFYRIINEVPTLLMIAIVFIVVAKPFQ